MRRCNSITIVTDIIIWIKYAKVYKNQNENMSKRI